MILASVVTKNHLKEFLFLKFSAEYYHTCEWYVYCDSYCYTYLKQYDNMNVFEANIGDGKVWGSKEEKDSFYKTILTKFDACHKALDEHKYVLFVDSDIVFTNHCCSLFEEFVESDLDVVASPHYQLAPEIDRDWGVFNVGFVLIKSKDLLNRWKEITLSKTYLYEQKPLEVAMLEGKFKWDTFPITYNMGWWRFNNQKTHNRFESLDCQRNKISYAGVPIISFHTHMFNTEDHPQCEELTKFLMNAFTTLSAYKEFSKKYNEILGISTPQPPSPPIMGLP